MNATAKKTSAKSHQRGLGKGLSALMSEGYSQALNSEDTDNDSPKNAPVLVAKNTLPLDKISPGKYQPRGYFNEQSLGELTDSIRRSGVMQPILVRAIDKDRYEIVAGERRWRAAQAAGLSEIPVLIREFSDEQALEVALVENVQREGLHALEEAAGYRRLMDEFNYTQETLSGVVHKSRSHIANLLRLLTLCPEVRTVFAEDKIVMGHARALMGLADEQAAELVRTVIERGLSVRQTEKLVQKSRAGRTTTTMQALRQNHERTPERGGHNQSLGGQKDPDIVALEETLSENLGLKVSINDRGQSGEIMVAYESLEQLDEILRRLGGGM